MILLSFLFTVPPHTVMHTLSLHDALPIFERSDLDGAEQVGTRPPRLERPRVTLHREHLRLLARRREDMYLDGIAHERAQQRDRKSTRLNSSHSSISYAVFCLKKKTN